MKIISRRRKYRIARENFLVRVLTCAFLCFYSILFYFYSSEKKEQGIVDSKTIEQMR